VEAAKEVPCFVRDVLPEFSIPAAKIPFSALNVYYFKGENRIILPKY